MKSVWTNTTKLEGFSAMHSDIDTDVLIIGGGICGLLLAYKLQNAGVDYVLSEQKTVCSGVTKDTTAKITSQHGFIYDKLTREFGKEGAKLYLDANQSALFEYRQLCSDIDCDFEEKDAFTYSSDPKKIEKELNALDKIGFEVGAFSELPLPFPVTGAVCFSNQAQFNPLKFAGAITNGLNIYENTKVVELIGTTARTNKGNIRAKRIVVCTHFPFLNKHGSYFLKLYQHRSYVTAYEYAQDVEGMYVDESDTGMSFRNYKELLFIGGGGHRTGKRGGNFSELEHFAKKYYPTAEEKYRWAAQDCMTLDGVPYIGNYSKNTPRLYVATGFNKWGMTSSMVAATMLTDMLTGKKSKYEDLFSPSRTMLRPQLAINAAEATVGLFTASKKRCPHMGCALKWNNAEHTWDCSCHGSRFTQDGALIDNPATDDLPSENDERKR